MCKHKIFSLLFCSLLLISNAVFAVSLDNGKKAGDRVVVTVNGVDIAFRWCPAGTFMMGLSKDDQGCDRTEPHQQVKLSKGFWIMETEITQKQWKAVMGNVAQKQRQMATSKNPSFFRGDDLPVEQVSWNDCQEFCKKCNELGLAVQLPTEAQWEYACRAGTTGAYAEKLGSMAWYDENSDGKTHPVATKKPNAWGIYDMHGNVWEWCQDWYEESPSNNAPKQKQSILQKSKAKSGKVVTDPTGPANGVYRVDRGGSWDYDADSCQSAFRGAARYQGVSYSLGFRCVIIGSEESAPAETASEEPASEQVQTSVLPESGTKAGERVVVDVNGIKYAFRWCPAGTFTMGSPVGEKGKKTISETGGQPVSLLDIVERQHKVTLTKGFWMLETEVTVGMFKAFVSDSGYKPVGWCSYQENFMLEQLKVLVEDGKITKEDFEELAKIQHEKYKNYSWSNPGFSQDDNCPVTLLCWDDAVAFCNWLSKKTGQKFQLPTEAQWEYACRAGTTGPFAGNHDEMAWYENNSEGKTHPVGTKKPNAWGLYDMHGNVYEYCKDYLVDYPSDSITDPDGMKDEDDPDIRAFRGGAFYSAAAFCRSANRLGSDGFINDEDLLQMIGFRFVAMGSSESTAEETTAEETTPEESTAEETTAEETTPAEEAPEEVLSSALPESGTKAGERVVIDVNGIKYAFRWCPAGKFTMGSPVGEKGKKTISEIGGQPVSVLDIVERQHKVTLTKGFWMLETEVTVGMFKAFVSDSGYKPAGWKSSDEKMLLEKAKEQMEKGELTKEQYESLSQMILAKYKKYSWSNPGFSQDDNCPVTFISWDDTVEFCNWLSKKTGQKFELPSESQWEYACRAGTTGPFAGNHDEMAWYENNSEGKTHPVGTKKPNAWGLYDMHGNVYEYCKDLLNNYPSDSVTDPVNLEDEDGFNIPCFRGGAFYSAPAFCRSANRLGSDFFRNDDDMFVMIGFRFVAMGSSESTPEESTDEESTDEESTDEESTDEETTPEESTDEESLLMPEPVQSNTGTKPGFRTVVKVNDVEFAFRWCPAGKFTMGSPLGEEGKNELAKELKCNVSKVDLVERQHDVTLTKGFWMLETEVTQKQWKAVMGNTPSYFKGDDLPVEQVSWNDCQEFCKKCKELGLPVQLPTNAQWEYACRAGTKGPFAGNLDQMAWYIKNSEDKTHPVGTKKANAWGIYDMYGNVAEWCQDNSGFTEDDTDPTGGKDDSARICRNGFYGHSAPNCRSARFYALAPEFSASGVGFRCVVMGDDDSEN